MNESIIQDDRQTIDQETEPEPALDTSLVSFVKEMAVTPDDTYSYGAFCRVNPMPNSDRFFVTFGGSNPDAQSKAVALSPFGGAEGGNGYSYKMYDVDFAYTGQHGVVHSGGGDAASVMADDGYYYFLAGAPPEDWILKKIDPTTWKTVASAHIDMDSPREILNDMMLAYANGNLIASGLYDASGAAGGDQKKSDPTVGMATHNRIFDTNLNLLDTFVLDDVPHINGSYVVFANGEYAYVTSTSFFGDLIVMRYDENWNFIDSKTIDKGAQWSQGASYDEAGGRFYVAYLDMPIGMNGKLERGQSVNVAVGIYDADWNLVEKVMITDFVPLDDKNPGRPSLLLHDGMLYVSYDVASLPGRGEPEAKDWQCTVRAYELNP